MLLCRVEIGPPTPNAPRLLRGRVCSHPEVFLGLFLPRWVRPRRRILDLHVRLCPRALQKHDLPPGLTACFPGRPARPTARGAAPSLLFKHSGVPRLRQAPSSSGLGPLLPFPPPRSSHSRLFPQTGPVCTRCSRVLGTENSYACFKTRLKRLTRSCPREGSHLARQLPGRTPIPPRRGRA